MKKISILITVVALIGLLLVKGWPSSFARENKPFTILSYPIDNRNLYKHLSDQVDYDYKVKYKSPIGSEVFTNRKDDVVKFSKLYQKKLSNKNPMNIRVLPFSSPSKYSALYDLETYILSYLGAGVKSDQRELIKGDVEIAKISLNMVNNGNLNYFSLYTAFKKGDTVFIVTTGYYADHGVTDGFDEDNSEASLIYSEIVRSFKFENGKMRSEEMNKLDRNSINPLIIDLYKEFNNKFKNTI